MTGTVSKASLFHDRCLYLCVATEEWFLCVYRTWVLWLCVCTDPICFYTSLWLKCVGIFQRIVNISSVSKSTVGIHVLESLYTTTTFRLHFIVGTDQGTLLKILKVSLLT